MPAAAVIPAPRVSMRIAAIKKFVVIKGDNLVISIKSEIVKAMEGNRIK